jgi:hypothetical protein
MISLITTRIKLVSFSLTILCMVCSVSSACPTCKEGLGSSSNLINGYGWSIVFMMSMPFLIFAGISGYFYYEVCRARAMQRIAIETDASADAIPTEAI